MNMKNLLALFLLSVSLTAFSQVEINASSPNAELEVISQTKGILLPRLNNTGVVTSPEEGLFIYDKAAKSPAFHDGAKWNSMIMMMPNSSLDDSLTYNLMLGPGPGGEELELESISEGGSGGEDRFTVNISKPRDKNRILLLRKFFINRGSTTNSVSMGPMDPAPNLVINIYHKGAATPYFTYKFTDWEILAYSTGHSLGRLGQSESYTLWARIIGYKDWATNETIAIDGKNIVPY
jgi:hypothetical protein